MAVSKRVRYAVLERDHHTCRYCGASAPDVRLQIDHVVPVALGGSDEPKNLVTSCEACNSGKASTTPSLEVVADIDESAARWASAMRQAAAEIADEREASRAPIRQWLAAWQEYGEPLPSDWETSLRAMLAAGADVDSLIELVGVAMASRARDPFRYFCGCAWNHVDAIRERALTILNGPPGQYITGNTFDDRYEEGYWSGHIDGWDQGYEAGWEQGSLRVDNTTFRQSHGSDPSPISDIIRQLKEGA